MEEITSRKNPLISYVKKLGGDKQARRDNGEFFCQGYKLLYEAIKWEAGVKTVLYCGDEPELPEGTRAVRVPKELIEYVSPMKSTPEVVFTCAMPELDGVPLPGRHLVMENMQDPGNVGTILRTADALQCGSVILVGNCADPAGPKAVRASMGAIFRHRIIEMTTDAFIDIAAEQRMAIFAAALDGTAADIRDVEFPKNMAFVIGNEGQGIGEELLKAADRRVIIPMDSRCESLNAAAAATVILWEMFRRG